MPDAVGEPKVRRRRMSVAAGKRIGEVQKNRWTKQKVYRNT
jgi:hypothetical protein